MRRIVLFDGECNFCDASVQFIIKRDTNAMFQFASLQSDVGQALIEKFAIPTTVDSIVLIEDECYYMKSTAALKIARRLDGLWKLSYAAIVLPKPLRDVVYSYIAKNRYKWFGKKEACMLPTAEQRNRFL